MLKDFTVEYRNNPIGLDVNPRFSWKLQSEQPDTMQKEYRIIVMDGEKKLWDTKEVESEQSLLVPYQGNELEPYTEYKVMVSVKDNHGRMQEITGSFETGVLRQENWKGQWITHQLSEEDRCPVFCHEFTLNKQLKKARVYATACGVYEIAINGEKAGDTFLGPGWTSYHNRLQYQSYDITDIIKCENKMEITVGNGWYKGFLNGEGQSCFYGNQTALLAQIYLEYDDGSVEITGTGTDWRITTGYIKSAELYHGEIQDFTTEPNEVTTQTILFDASKIVSAIVAQECEPIRVTKRFAPVRKIVTPKGELVIDFGQNMAGLVEVKLPKLAGDQLIIRHGETLDKEGNFYIDNLRAAICTDTYIYGEKEIEKVVMPHFTYHGFRYICIEGVTEDIDISRFTACAMHTDMKQTGTFVCDNELVNKLQRNIEWGQRSNFFDIPTDCPQRDERLGWTGDAQIFCPTAAYNFDTALFFKKWMRDVAVETTPENGVPHVVPNIHARFIGSSIWSDCATIIPWNMYQVYGDRKILEEQYNSMKCWVEYIRRSCGETVLWMNGFQRGDWLGLDREEGASSLSGSTDKDLVANAYYACSVRIVRNTAKILGNQKDYEVYGRLYEQIVAELNDEYVTKHGRLVTETQTACALLLYFSLIKEEYRERIIKTLEDNLMQHKNHLTTGFVGTAFLCHVLTENGKHNLAEEVFFQEDFPGWFYAVKMGATTIWERWDSVLPDRDFNSSGMNSLNHYTYGSIGDWMYKKIAGINLIEPGYKKIGISPVLTKGITEVKAALETVYGTVESAWSCKNGRIIVDVTIPANTTAVLRLPEKEEDIQLGSGVYHYEYETETSLITGKYSMNSTLAEIMNDCNGKQILKELMPEMSDNPMIGFLRGKTLAEILKMAPDTLDVYEQLLEKINKIYITDK